MRLLPALILVMLFCALRAAAAEDIPPPFGFRWNDPAAKVEQVLTTAKAKIVSREKKESIQFKCTMSALF